MIIVIYYLKVVIYIHEKEWRTQKHSKAKTAGP